MSASVSSEETVTINGKEYVRLPYKSSICNERICKWVFIRDDGVLVPEELLKESGIIQGSGKLYVLKDIADKLYLLGIYRGRIEEVKDIYGNNVETDIDELEEKLEEYTDLWRKALNVAPPSPPVYSPDDIQLKTSSSVYGLSIYSKKFTISFRKKPGYNLITIDAPEKLRLLLSSILKKILAKYGFTEGKYGGLISHETISEKDLEKMKKEMLETLEKNIHEITRMLNRIEREKYEIKKHEIEEARRKLGINLPATSLILPDELMNIILNRPIPTETEEVLLKENEIPSLEEALAGWTEPIPVGIEAEPSVPTAVESSKKSSKKHTQPVQPAPEETEEQRLKAIKSISRDDIVRAMIGMGFKPVKMIVFDLPTEYKGAETVYEKAGNKYIEKKIMSVDPREYRSLRRSFYSILHRIAYRTPAGWIMLDNIDKNDLKELDRVIGKLNKLSGTGRTVWIIESYMPRNEVREWLTTYIQQRRANLEEIKKKMMEPIIRKKQLRRLQREYSMLLEELHRLEEQLRHI